MIIKYEKSLKRFTINSFDITMNKDIKEIPKKLNTFLENYLQLRKNNTNSVLIDG